MYPPPPYWGAVKKFRKVFACAGRGSEIFFRWGGGNFCCRVSLNFKLKLKIYHTSIKSIFGITNLIYFRDIWQMHLLIKFWKIYFLMAICRKYLEHSVVFLAVIFWTNFDLMFPSIPFCWNSRVWSFFSSVLGIETFFLKV